MSNKRVLNFSSLDDAIAEVETLLSAGYESTGNWNLSQCCGHLDQWLGFPMDGFPKANFVVSGIFWMMKLTVGKGMLKKILKEGFKPGSPTAPATVPQPDAASDSDSIAALKATVERFKAYSDPIHASPLFGEMDKPTALALQLRHFEHHLGFLKPKS